MSTMQLKSHSTSIAGRRRLAVGSALGAVFRRIGAALVLWRSRAAARRRMRTPRYLDDRLLADIGLTRLELKLPTRDFMF
jgi:uncharacterized protein YjiS (DUF1127 family)